MRENEIKLKFDNTISGLAGNRYGVDEYESQIKDKFDYNKLNIIVFPNNIQKIAISFIQGMFSEILTNISKENIDKFIQIKASSKKLEDKIVENIKF